MFGMYISAAVICAAAVLVGRAIFAWLGEERWTWLEPAVGLAALITLGGILGRIPETDWTATILMGALVVWAALSLRRPYDMREVAVPALCAGLVALLLLSIPFAISERWGLLGVGFNNDFGLHLAWSEHLRSGFGPEPWSGYPVGPHGVAVATSSVPGISLGKAFTGELLAISLLTAVTAAGALRGLHPAFRIGAAALVAVSYLGASYYAQSAFKETAEALFVLAFALGLSRLAALRGGDAATRRRVIVPAALLVTGMFFAYSFAGVAWPVAILAAWSLTLPEVRAALSPARVWGRVRRRSTLIGIAVLAAAVVLLAFVGPFGFAEGFGEVAGSNTYGPVSPVEALGVWPASNYRLDAVGGAPLPWLAGAIGILGLGFALAWWVRRRELTVPLALGACVALYLIALPVSGDYSRAKALVIMAPLAMLVALRGLLAGDDAGPEGGGPSPARRSRGGRSMAVMRPVVAVVFCVGAVYSSFLVLRDAPVNPEGHGAELAEFTDLVRGERTLYAGQDRFAAYELLGADTSVPVVEFPDEAIRENSTKPFDTGDAYSPIDFNSFSNMTLDNFRYVVTGSAAWNSTPPGNFEEVDRTDSYVLWERSGPTNRRRTLLEGEGAAARLDCRAPESQLFATQQVGEASLFPDPVIGDKESWEDSSTLSLGEEAHQTLNLPAGTYRLSIQYFSPVDLRLSAPGFDHPLVAALDGQRPNTISLGNDGQFWPAGTYDSEGGPIEFRIFVDKPTRLQELTGYDGTAYLGALVAVPDEPHDFLPLAQTCGRWIDWYLGEMGP